GEEVEWRRGCLEQGLAVYNAQQRSLRTFPFAGHDPGVCCYGVTGVTWWLLGYPSQAWQRMPELLRLAQRLAHPLSLASAYNWVSRLALLRRQTPALREHVAALMSVASEHGFRHLVAIGAMLRSAALLEEGRVSEGMAHLQQSLEGYRATGTEAWRPYFLALLSAAQGEVGKVEQGLALITEALDTIHTTGERWCEAEVYRLQGELLVMQQHLATGRHGDVETQRASASSPEGCFLHAIAIARHQQVKSLEL